MSEKALQEALKTTLETLPGWNSNVTVIINDWHILDGSLDNAPYALIETADSVVAQLDQMIPVTDWQIPVTLFIRFVDWQETYDQLRDLRQSMLDEIAGNEYFRGYLVNVVRTEGPIGEWYDPHQNPDTNPAPVFVTQRLVLEVEEQNCE
jgi:hypothetical protein